MQLPMAQIGVDTKLFEVLTETDGTATNAELAKKTGIDPALSSTCNPSILTNRL